MSKKAMDIHNKRNVDTPEHEAKEIRSCMRLVGYGEGLPYAPENWPNPGDLWGWKIEKKLTIFGYHLERHLYLPESLHYLVDVPGVLKNGFTSKSSLRRFLHMHFPHFDVDAFFDSFSWRILSTHAAITGCGNGSLTITGNIDNHGTNFDIMPILDHPSDVMSNTSACKAGNTVCSSLKESIDSPPLVAAQCSVCCTEPKFCGDCCCILCSKIVDPSHGGYSYIKCQSIVTACLICSHVAHLECALRVYMAGTIGGSIGFDAEYLCRRCNVKTDLVPHTVKAFQACRQIDSRDEIEKILTMCICILRGTQKDHGRDLLKRIEAAARKLKRGTTLEDIWEADAPGKLTFDSIYMALVYYFLSSCSCHS
ncbi:Protein OBERON 1 [Linum grandiflorum]